MNENEEELEELEEEQPSTPKKGSMNYTLKDFFKMIGRHWVGLVICSLIGLAGGVAYDRVAKTPEFAATSQVIVYDSSSTETNADEALTQARYHAQAAVGYFTVSELQKACIDTLTDTANKDTYRVDYYSTAFLKGKDSNGEKIYNLPAFSKLYSASLTQVWNNTSSIYIAVSATGKDAQEAIDIANVTVTELEKIANTEGSTMYPILHGYIHPQTTNIAYDKSTSTAVIVLVGTLIGAVVGCFYGIIRELSATKINTRKEVETITGVKVIGMIPDYAHEKIQEDVSASLGEEKKEGK